MDDSNNRTLHAYERHVQEYISGTPQVVDGFMKDWIDKALSYVPKDGKVLEIGSAFGRDAVYMEQAGYKVRRTDATKAFVELLRSQGHEADVLNAITDDLGGPYDLVFADAVLLHFTLDEFQSVVAKVYDSLNEGGVFAFTVKQGEGSAWMDDKLGIPRFFQYWSKDGLQTALDSATFTTLSLNEAGDGKWLHVVAQKA